MSRLEFTRVITVRIKTTPVSVDADERIYERLVENLLLSGLEKVLKIAIEIRRIFYALHLTGKIHDIKIDSSGPV